MGSYLKKCLIIVGLCIVILCGCSSNQKEQYAGIVSDFLRSYQSQDVTCGKYLSGNEQDAVVQFEGFQSILAAPVKFKIKSVHLNEEDTVVNVDITNVDFSAVVERMLNEEFEAGSAEAVIAELKHRLQAEDAPTTRFSVPVKVNKEQKIEMTSDLSNALLGGYPQFIYELTEGDLQ